MSRVYWITGLSGAGKTTIGKIFYEHLKKECINTVFLDGDNLRKVFGDDLGYTEEERRKCAMRYSKLCKMLQEQDINVICCTISMFNSVREWNRNNISDYVEIYIKASIETLYIRNQKELYSASLAGIKSDVVGMDIPIEEPQMAELVLENNGEKTPEEQADIIMDYFLSNIKGKNGGRCENTICSNRLS